MSRSIEVGAFVLLVGATLGATIHREPGIKVHCTTRHVAQPQDEIWDFCFDRDVVIDIRISEVSLASNRWVKLHAQTANTLAETDFETVLSLVFNEASDTTPKGEHALLSTNSNVPLGRFVRWEVEFQDTLSTQYVVFGAELVGRP
ncbi:MAG: hypothetical protein CME06_02465 [Gemmatimonadetes bacterium]|nr:hypothetical protein [Gemmatimonadota bacterium]